MKNSPAIPLHTLAGPKSLNNSFTVKIWGKTKPTYDFTTPHRHDFDEIMFFTRGGGVHEIDFNQVSIADHSIHFVRSGQVHLLLRDGNSEGCSLLFAKNFFEEYILKKRMSFQEIASSTTNITMPAEAFKKIIFILDRINDFFSQEQKPDKMLLLSWIEVLLFEIISANILSQERSNAHQGSAAVKYKDFLDMLDTLWPGHLSVEVYSQRLNITSNYLNKICKLFAQKSSMEIINEKYLSEAKRLLFFTEKSIKEIAYELRFEDPSYFNRFFKKNTGYTPNEYRYGIKLS